MVWFECGDCGESIKKPKVDAHKGRCPSSHFTCLDCSRTFGRNDVKVGPIVRSTHIPVCGPCTDGDGLTAFVACRHTPPACLNMTNMPAVQQSPEASQLQAFMAILS